jgi:Transposase, Mutator family
MTDDGIALCQLVEKSAGADLLREMIGVAAEWLMELEVQGLTGADYGERAPDRLAQRNGYRDRAALRGDLGGRPWEPAAGRPAPGRSSCASPSSGRAATSRASWSRGGWRRRPSRR